MNHTLTLAALPAAEQETLLREIGDLVLQSAIARLVVTFTDADAAAFTQAVAKLEVMADDADVLPKLIDQYPQLATLLEEEAARLQQDMQAVLPSGA